MCLALPGQVISIDGSCATVDFDGVLRAVQLDLLPEVAAGDYVLTHAGFAIQLIGREEAEKTLELFRGIAAAEGAGPEASGR